MTGLKRNYPNLKVSLAIGGWNEGSANYSALAASPNRRNTFVKSVFNYLRQVQDITLFKQHSDLYIILKTILYLRIATVMVVVSQEIQL